MLTIEEIGHIYNFLLKKRVARSFNTKHVDGDEKYVGTLLENNLHALDDLQEFLSSQQLKLEILSAQQYGFARSGNAFVIYPSHTETDILPSHLRSRDLWEAVKDSSRKENKFTSVVWTSFFYLHLLYFLYTQDDRPIEAISMYKDTWVTEDDFAARVNEEIELLRINEQGESSSTTDVQSINAVLLDSTIIEVSRRVTRFFNAMTKFKVLEKKTPDDAGLNFQQADKHIYVQTLWSAVDIAKNFNRNASLILTFPDAKAVQTFAE